MYVILKFLTSIKKRPYSNCRKNRVRKLHQFFNLFQFDSSINRDFITCFSWSSWKTTFRVRKLRDICLREFFLLLDEHNICVYFIHGILSSENLFDWNMCADVQSAPCTWHIEDTFIWQRVLQYNLPSYHE